MQTEPLPVAQAVEPAADFAPRDPSEWQGMRVDRSMMAECETTAQCGLAMACHRGRCGACISDGDCVSGEVCALDHCVVAERAGCRSRRDCGGEALCVLTGYSSDPRGNADMRATCVEARGGRPQTDDAPDPTEFEPAPPVPVRPDRLLESLDDPAP